MRIDISPVSSVPKLTRNIQCKYMANCWFGLIPVWESGWVEWPRKPPHVKIFFHSGTFLRTVFSKQYCNCLSPPPCGISSSSSGSRSRNPKTLFIFALIRCPQAMALTSSSRRIFQSRRNESGRRTTIMVECQQGIWLLPHSECLFETVLTKTLCVRIFSFPAEGGASAIVSAVFSFNVMWEYYINDTPNETITAYPGGVRSLVVCTSNPWMFNVQTKNTSTTTIDNIMIKVPVLARDLMPLPSCIQRIRVPAAQQSET